MDARIARRCAPKTARPYSPFARWTRGARTVMFGETLRARPDGDRSNPGCRTVVSVRTREADLWGPEGTSRSIRCDPRIAVESWRCDRRDTVPPRPCDPQVALDWGVVPEDTLLPLRCGPKITRGWWRCGPWTRCLLTVAVRRPRGIGGVVPDGHAATCSGAIPWLTAERATLRPVNALLPRRCGPKTAQGWWRCVRWTRCRPSAVTRWFTLDEERWSRGHLGLDSVSSQWTCRTK